jgi:hypothetical protein
MASNKAGAATDSKPAATATAGPDGGIADAGNQNDSVTINQLTELQGKFSELETFTKRLEQEKNDAVAATLREQAKYKGLQNQTTKTLQDAAENRRVLEQMRQDRAELSEIKEVLGTLASRVLDEPERKDLEFRQRELRLKLAEEGVAEAQKRAQEQPAQAVASPQYSTPEDAKSEYMNYYFPGENVDPNDSNIDWGDGAQSTQEAVRRFNMSVLKIISQKNQARTQDSMAAIQKQTDETLAQFKKEQGELLTKTQEEIEKAKTDAINQARKDSEKKLRALGADVSGTPAPDGGRRTLMEQMTDELPDDLLRTKSGQAEYRKRLEAIKNQVRGR